MVKIKICGLMNQADYNNAVILKSDYTGFIFYKRSKRYVNEETAGHIIRNGPKLDNLKVGVFVNETIEEVRRIFHFADLDIIQLHGDEDTAYCNDLGLPYWKVLRIKDEGTLQELDNYKCDTFLIDAYEQNVYGGTGRAIDEAIVKKILSLNKKIIVAGGLSLKNIGSVLELNPFGVDINSSVEDTAGKKNIYKMQQIIEKIRGYNNGNI